MSEPITDPVIFTFTSKAAPEQFKVWKFSGREEISRPYRFDIDLTADDPDLDLENLLYAPATLTIEKGDAVRKVQGIVAECRLLDELPHRQYHYQVVLRPRLWLLSLNLQNQIYMGLSVPEIVQQEIEGHTAKGSTKPAFAGLAGDDYEMLLTRKYPGKATDNGEKTAMVVSPAREYAVQYNESDLAFISRLMEHEGLFYFFRHEEEREKLIISDNNVHFPAIQGDGAVAYRPASAQARSGDEAVLSFAGATRRIPRKVILKDYNYRKPGIELKVEADVDTQAHGLVYCYGDHFKTNEEGKVLAAIRAEELICAKRRFSGTSDVIRLLPGHRFKLEEHFRKNFRTEYLLTRLQHTGRQPLEGMEEKAFYGNDFGCIPAEVAYRPPRRTPKPRIHGLMTARVDGALDDERAQIDGEGRYKLTMPFDLSDPDAGKASRYVRKAQPYGGCDMGMHFPLLKGTEVVCSFVNGDPDRPIIAGAVPNPEEQSVVTSQNPTRNVIKTASGVLFEINDGRPKQKG